MKKNNIDKLFKENASSGRFPVKESYWADAEKMLSQSNSASAAGFFKESLSGLVFLLIGTTALLFLLHAQNSKDQFQLNNTAPIAAEETTINQSSTQIKNSTDNPHQNSTLLNEGENFDDIKKPVSESNNSAITHKNTATKTHTTVNKNSSTPMAATQNADAILNKGNAEPFSNEPKSAGLTQEKSANDFNEIAAETPVSSAPSHENASLKTEANTATTALPYLENEDQNANAINRPEVASNKPGEGESETNPKELKSDILNHPESEKPESLVAEDDEEAIPPDYTPFKSADNFTFNVGLEYSYLLTSRFLSSPNTSLEDFRTQYETPKNMTSFGVNFQVGYKNWLFNSGIYQTKITDVLNYPNTLLVTVGEDNGSWNTYEDWTYNVDSSWVIDSVYHGHWNTDTTWNLDYDSTYTAQWDSVDVEKEDPELTKNNGKLTLSYIEVPLWFGRSFSAKRFTFDVQGGFAVGLLTATSDRRYINSSVDGLSTADIEQYQKILFQTMFRAGVRVKVTDRLEASFYPTLRYTLNSVLKGQAVNQKYLGYGFSVGISYGL